MSTAPVREDVPVGAPQALRLLQRDLREMALHLSVAEVRFLVDYYYQQQENRKAARSQERAALAAGESCQYTGWLAGLEAAIENQIKSALDLWTQEHPASRWAKSQRGIGPVLAAGLAAHIDLDRTLSVSRLWRFAGQDPTVEWHGTKNARELVAAAFQGTDSPIAACLFLARATQRHPSDLIARSADVADLDQFGITRTLAQEVLVELSGAHATEIEELFAQRPLQLDNAIGFAADQLGMEQIDIYEVLFADLSGKIERERLISFLAKRPWNARLKVLCWKIGESFVYQSGSEDCFYGQLYRQYKAEEQRRNAEGQFAPQAATLLQKRRIGEETLARQRYEAGQLPDAHIHARAKRRAVKMFLSHYWQVAYLLHHRQLPPRPWIIEFGGHIDLIQPPGWDALVAETLG